MKPFLIMAALVGFLALYSWMIYWLRHHDDRIGMMLDAVRARSAQSAGASIPTPAPASPEPVPYNGDAPSYQPAAPRVRIMVDR